MLRIPPWLPLVLSPFVFLGGCTMSLLPAFELEEWRFTHPVRQSELRAFPLLAQKDGKYVVTGQPAAEGATVVTSVSRADEKKINRDLNAALGVANNYPWFRILDEHDGIMHVSMEAPTRKESKRMGWYTLGYGAPVLERTLYYSVGFIYCVIPWTLAGGALSWVLYKLAIRRLQRMYPAVFRPA